MSNFFFGVWASGLVAFFCSCENKYGGYIGYLFIVFMLAKSLSFSILAFYLVDHNVVCCSLYCFTTILDFIMVVIN